MLKNLKRQEEGKLFKKLEVTEKDEMCVLIAALCHELGIWMQCSAICILYNIVTCVCIKYNDRNLQLIYIIHNIHF